MSWFSLIAVFNYNVILKNKRKNANDITKCVFQKQNFDSFKLIKPIGVTRHTNKNTGKKVIPKKVFDSDWKWQISGVFTFKTLIDYKDIQYCA